MTLTSETLQAYKIGDNDTRPWGNYIVIALGSHSDGEEFCEKNITVNKFQILSLQSHKLRRERWTVIKGTLTVILNDSRLTLNIGDSLEIPQGAIHCMANLDTETCIVHEIQEGICREDDILRYIDAYARTTEPSENPLVITAIALYKTILSEIETLQV